MDVRGEGVTTVTPGGVTSVTQNKTTKNSTRRNNSSPPISMRSDQLLVEPSPTH